jgi:hypothetical protein
MRPVMITEGGKIRIQGNVKYDFIGSKILVSPLYIIVSSKSKQDFPASVKLNLIFSDICRSIAG